MNDIQIWRNCKLIVHSTPSFFPYPLKFVKNLRIFVNHES